jgi:DNA-binding NtrC family response regulator
VASFERRYLSHLLRETGGAIGETAARAGINPKTLYEKMKTHDLRKEDFRRGATGRG